jgi:hypothetical protein
LLIVSFCKETKEYVCSFPEDTFQTLPTPHEMSVFKKTSPLFWENSCSSCCLTGWHYCITRHFVNNSMLIV